MTFCKDNIVNYVGMTVILASLDAVNVLVLNRNCQVCTGFSNLETMIDILFDQFKFCLVHEMTLLVYDGQSGVDSSVYPFS